MRLRGTIDHGGLPADVTVTAIVAREGLSELDDIQVELATIDGDVELEPLLRTSCVVGIERDGDEVPRRLFHGVVEEATYAGPTMRLAAGVPPDAHGYRLRMRPAISGLSYRVRSRIFQDLAAPDLVASVLEGAGIPPESLRRALGLGYPKHAYTVQWKESELAFVRRLLEREGIFFRFEHGADDAVLELLDSTRSAKPIDGDPILVLSDRPRTSEQGVHHLTLTHRVCPDAYLARDWNFERPHVPRQGEARRPRDGGLFVYEYPGGFDEDARGLELAERRLEEINVAGCVLSGKTTCRRLAPGRLIAIVGSAGEPWIEGEYLVTSVTHRFSEQNSLPSPLPSNEPGTYEAQFEAIPRDVPFRAPRSTPRPRIAGRETAVVTGPAGEEIHTDAYGRVRVRFYWDREGPNDDGSSCWLRVQQPNTSGSMLLPRVGWEVEVGFVDGDPDRPVVLSRAYEADSLPPYGLPAGKTRNAMQTASSPGGGGTNEIRTEDACGGMEMFVHASRDHSVNVGHDCREEVKVDASDSVGITLTTNVAFTETVIVGGNQSINVTGGRIDETGGDRKVTIGPLDDWGVKGNLQIKNDGWRKETVGSTLLALANKVAETFNADYARDVTGLQAYATPNSIVESVAGTKDERVGGAKMEVIKGSRAESIGKAKALTSGFVRITTGKDITYGAKGAVTLKAGKIEEQIDGVLAVAGMGIEIQASTKAVLKAGGVSFTAAGGSLKIEGGKLGVTADHVKLKGKKVKWQ